jgi:hypothetical protein
LNECRPPGLDEAQAVFFVLHAVQGLKHESIFRLGAAFSFADQKLLELAMEQRQALEVAVELYKREHDRWNHWALFFFGGIGGTFVISGQLAELALPAVKLVIFAVASTVCTIVSLMWTIAAMSIRSSTLSWHRVIRILESEPVAVGAFELFDALRKTRESGSFADPASRSEVLLLADVGVPPLNLLDWLWTLPLCSWRYVTSLLVYFGLLSTIAFAATGVVLVVVLLQ